MSTRFIRILKPVIFLLALVPFFGMVWSFRADTLGADPVQTLTHWTGDWTMYMLLASLAITPIRRLSPTLAWLIRCRRMIGLFAFFYGTLHLLTYVFLFSGFDLPDALAALRHGQFYLVSEQWRTVWPIMMDDVAKRRFIQVGLLAYAILLALAVTSPQWMLRAMGGKPWQTLHRTVYAAAVLGVLHYWWLVKKGVMSPAKVTVVLGVLLLARLTYFVWKKRSPVVRPV
jgi:sulfoxide reductase heme-binding subunit YedZ